ncbi:MAG: carbamoyltransferase HypF [Thermoclostridium sp.]|nr:carbamoyltransferase HypF [Thermoclostridium sp.]
MNRYSLIIRGIVQGVGFRPYLYRLAKSLSIRGFVQNTTEGIYAEIEGDAASCDSFIAGLQQHPPALARIESIQTHPLPVQEDTDFVILESLDGERNAFISPDIGICDACAADIMDKSNRRWRYAFTNCTDCGPRYTILRDIPYDRKNTMMAGFPQCPDCLHEYEDPADRRFHAQPNACPVCGPMLSFCKAGEILDGDPFVLFDQWVHKGRIIAVKGIGGYHLACDAVNEAAVKRLRKNKIRYDKPFAVMMHDIDTVRKFCDTNEQEEKTLLCPRKPIVLLKKKENCSIAEDTSPKNNRIGVMLPYTPLHVLLMQNHDALVMTSANLSDRPMIYDDAEAMQSFNGIADAILTHNRQIYRRMDDSVGVFVSGKLRLIRRSRGYAPEPIRLYGNNRVILALGAQQKNTFCLVKGDNAFLSGHIGDLDDPDTESFYENEIQSYMRLFDAKPDIIACDMHPDYVSTRYAARFIGKLPVCRIQHHHAHFASVLAEHQVEEPVIGLIFDGTGYGMDRTIWGGEALFGDIRSSERIGHLRYASLLGGEAAIHEPWRMALAMMCDACGESDALDCFEAYGENAALLLRMKKQGIQSPVTSSVGRLFDAVAALTGLRTHTSYEGQAAADLEQAIDSSADGSYGFDVLSEGNCLTFDWRQLIRDIVRDAKKGLAAGIISVRFHRAMIQLMTDVASLAKKRYGSNRIALSGGVFQNVYLLENGVSRLERCGFQVFSNEMVPANDGGIAYGQAAAASRLNG